jgi:hypothetical protein
MEFSSGETVKVGSAIAEPTPPSSYATICAERAAGNSLKGDISDDIAGGGALTRERMNQKGRA